MKQKIILLILLGVTENLFGQNNIVWLDSEFGETKDSTTANYKRIVQSYNSDKTINVTDYHKTGEKFFEGSVVYINAGLPVNNFRYFYKTGKLKSEGNQTVLKPSGFEHFTEKQYYPNGQLRCEYEGAKSKIKFIQSFDSLGNSLLTNGNGSVSFEIAYYHQLWNGKVKNFKMDSIWVGLDNRTYEVKHIELFARGIFLKGITLTNGQKINYKYESGYVKPSFARRIKKVIRAEINKQVPKSEQQDVYKVGVVFINGMPTKVTHLRKSLADKRIDFSKIAIPDYTFIEKGFPIESLTLGIKI